MKKTLSKTQIDRLNKITVGHGNMTAFVKRISVSRSSVYKALWGDPVNENIAKEIINAINNHAK